ncbi:MAG TPA: aldose 1-epimerase [Gemmataceae bacterium]|nr:aldose 1-epimerase [Gemmataceae bacterium]
MAFQVQVEDRLPSHPEVGPVYVLLESTLGQMAQVLPAMGFNCFNWQIDRQGRKLDLLYGDGLFGPSGKATRGGIPILFPFPNRIRSASFLWDGKTYTLPVNDSSGPNAIHGFACRKPWRVVDQGSSPDSAWVTGEFHGSVDAPESVSLWPADYRIRVTIRLSIDQVRLEASIHNPDTKPLPFGLGYHPYFRIPFAADDSAKECWISAPAERYWELEKGLPTGRKLPVDSSRDLRRPRAVKDLNLDDVLTELPSSTSTDLRSLGRVTQPAAGCTVDIAASPSFTQVVAFTPANRQAVCLEPYTCVTDAINLQQKGIEAGWLVLQPSETWNGMVVLSVT